VPKSSNIFIHLLCHHFFLGPILGFTNAKLEKVDETSSCVEHVIICNRCKYFDVDVCDEHLTSIAKLNNEVASLNAQLKTCKVDYDKLKFARDAYTVGRHPSIKDELGFRKETKNLTSQKTLVLNKEKGKAPMASSSQKNHAYMLGNLLGMLIMIDPMIMLFYLVIILLMLWFLLALLMLMIEIGLGVIMSCLMRLGEIAIVLLLSIILVMLLLCCHAKIQK
jgi:hypothetical protein